MSASDFSARYHRWPARGPRQPPARPAVRAKLAAPSRTDTPDTIPNTAARPSFGSIDCARDPSPPIWCHFSYTMMWRRSEAAAMLGLPSSLFRVARNSLECDCSLDPNLGKGAVGRLIAGRSAIVWSTSTFSAASMAARTRSVGAHPPWRRRHADIRTEAISGTGRLNCFKRASILRGA